MGVISTSFAVRLLGRSHRVPKTEAGRKWRTKVRAGVLLQNLYKYSLQWSNGYVFSFFTLVLYWLVSWKFCLPFLWTPKPIRDRLFFLAITRKTISIYWLETFYRWKLHCAKTEGYSINFTKIWRMAELQHGPTLMKICANSHFNAVQEVASVPKKKSNIVCTQ